MRWRYIKAVIWMVHTFGLRKTIRYERARRAGMTIDYNQVFGQNETPGIEE